MAKNSYNAVRFLAATETGEPARKDTYTLVLPPINRQLLDLLFSLVYMLEEFRPRSLAYQKAGWRELVEERETYRCSFASNPMFRRHLRDMEAQIERLATAIGITPEEKRSHTSIPYWPTPTQMVDLPGTSRQFRRHLMKWVYRDVSSQAHLGFSGLQKMAGFLLADLFEDFAGMKAQRIRATQSYHFQQVSRTAAITLAIATEIDTHLNLGNDSKADYLWVLLGEHVPEAKELWEERYRGRVPHSVA